MRKYDLVVTTIFPPDWLEGYLENIDLHGWREAVTLRIIPDRRTPESVYDAARRAAARGFSVDCPGLGEQQAYLARLGLDEEFVPFDSDNRRNIGYLRAWESGSDVLISIDDDNHCRSDSDFIAAHDAVGRPVASDPDVLMAGGGEWLNVCSLLDGCEATIYPRGFPYGARDGGDPELSVPDERDGQRMVAVNAGLWIDDPDVDAITRLALRPRVSAARPGSVVLAGGTWTPVNTQNTALHRAAVPAYWYVRMGEVVNGVRIDRFGDIWSGYFLQACARALGEVVRVGAPVADHRRSTHNLFLDLQQELAGIVLTETLVPWLRELRLTGSDYGECYAELADALEAQSGSFRGLVWDDGGREFLAATAARMRTWLRALRALGGS